MSESKKTSPDGPPEEVLGKLADLARVPDAQRAFYSESIRMNVQTACERERLAKKGITKKQGTTLHRSALAFYEVLGNLTEGEQQFINSILGGKSEFIFDRISSGGFGGLRKTAYQIALLFSLLTGKPNPRYPHETLKPRKKGRRAGGRRPGSVKDPIFQDFICDLWISTNAARGKLSFEKNTPRGTVFGAIKLLSPHLPEGFAPKALPASTVQKLKNLCNRAELLVAASEV
jgi:hypothetical protein